MRVLGRWNSRFAVGCALLTGLTACGQADRRDSEVTAASKAVNDFKASYSPRQVATSDALRRAYSSLIRAEQRALRPGQAELDTLLSPDPALANALSHKQLAAWQSLIELSGRAASITWGGRVPTPAAVDVGLNFRAPTAIEARAEAKRLIGPVLRDLFERRDEELVLQDQESFEVPGGIGVAHPMKVHRDRYERVVGGVPVFGDWYTETFHTTEEDPNDWRLSVAANWTPHANAATGAVLSAGNAVDAARSSGELPDGVPVREVRLGLHRSAGQFELAYRVMLGDGPHHRLYYVSASDGRILESQDQDAESASGSISASVMRPYESSPVVRPLPSANIYEEPGSQHGDPGCGYGGSGQDQWMGLSSTFKGTTNYSGAYSGLTDYEVGDNAWVVDLKGPHLKDISANVNVLTLDVTGGAAYTIPFSTTSSQNRRSNVFYLLNYAWSVYAGNGVPQYEPLGFTFFTFDDSAACPAPTVGTDCCSGKTFSGCVYLQCDMGRTSPPIAERRFREVMFHEQTHSLRFHSAGNLCGQCTHTPATDGPECNCWEEGRADFGAIALGQFEKSRPEYSPDRKYPGDMDLAGDADYGPASIWSSIYTHYLLLAGVSAIGDVNSNLYQVDTSTRMVGSCGSTTDISTCPANSFYRQLLANQQALTYPRWRNSEEISEVFHAHVTDADRGVTGAQAFPWADETPNRFLTSPFVYTEGPGGARYYVTQGAAGGGTLRLNSADDYDTFMFFARKGESYTIGTDNLASGVDTILEIDKITSTDETVITSNDDCAPPQRHSCVTFTSADNSFYRVRVNPYPGSITGVNATYRVYVDTSSDDYGDTVAAATPVSPDNVLHSPQGKLNAAGDLDVFTLAVAKASQNLTYLGCSTGGTFNVQVELLDPSNAVVDTYTKQACSSTPRTFSLASKGIWKLRVSAPDGSTGDYGLRVGLAASDIDIDNTTANAWNMASSALYGARFETTTDNDWFKISATAGRYYIVEAIALDSGVNTKLEVYAPTKTLYGGLTSLSDALADTSGQGLGHWMLTNSGGGLRGSDARVNFWAPINGVYYVRVAPEGSSVAGRYMLVIHDSYGVTQAYPPFP